MKKPDRPILLRLFRRMVYAETKEKYDELYQDLLSDSTAKKYPKFVQHLEQQYFTRSEKFTKYFRMDNNLPLHGVNTSNITEASFRVFRDVTLNRTKCFNACELQLEMLKDDASYYRDKL